MKQQLIPYERIKHYRKYLKSEEWKILRKKVLKRDSQRCVRCTAIGYLEVHHIHYNGIETMDFSMDQLESICRECHDMVHNGKLPMKKE